VHRSISCITKLMLARLPQARPWFRLGVLPELPAASSAVGLRYQQRRVPNRVPEVAGEIAVSAEDRREGELDQAKLTAQCCSAFARRSPITAEIKVGRRECRRCPFADLPAASWVAFTAL
jgi:hypothetical protein